MPRGPSKNRRGARPAGGFTLIELLTSMVIAALIFAAIGALLLAASQVTGLLEARRGAVLENAVIAIEKIKRDIQDSPVYPDIPFEGSADKLSFPKWVHFSGDLGLGADFKLGQVRTVTLGQGYDFRKIEYLFDKSRGALVRKEGEGEGKILVEHLRDARFSYALASLPSLTASWSDKTPKAGDPTWIEALSIRLTFDPQFSRYTIPGVEKTFVLIRQHPKNSLLPEIQTKRDEIPSP